MPDAFLSRISGAPISWGVSEQPSWGARMDARRVLEELTSVGLSAIELGDNGFFPDSNADTLALLGEFGEHGVQMVGGFVPLLLHDANRRADALERAEIAACRLAGTGAQFFVTAAVMDYDWRTPMPIAPADFAVLSESLKAVDDVCERHGLTQVLHPHVNTVVETKRDVELALEASDVRWCIDTGHLAIGGVDPLEFVREHASRIAQAHLKDVRLVVAPRVLSRELTMREAVEQGLFQPFGQGDVSIRDVVLTLEASGYAGWYVLEQDTFLPELPAPGEGPVSDLRTSVDYLMTQVVPMLAA
jgi:inosose dehydratase